MMLKCRNQHEMALSPSLSIEWRIFPILVTTIGIIIQNILVFIHGLKLESSSNLHRGELEFFVTWAVCGKQGEREE